MKTAFVTAFAMYMAAATAGCTANRQDVYGPQWVGLAAGRPETALSPRARTASPASTKTPPAPPEEPSAVQEAPSAAPEAPAAEGSEGPLSLEECVDLALRNNPDIAQRQWDTETALAEKDIAEGALWPTVHGQGGFMHYREDRLIKPRRPGARDVLGFSDNLLFGEVVLGMPLYTGGRLRNQVKAAELLTRSADQRLAHSRMELVFNVSSVFYSMLGQKEAIDSLLFSQKALLEHQKRTKELLQAQKAARVDLLRTEVRLADIEQQLLQERNVLDVQRFVLASLLGLEKQSVAIQGQLTMDDGPGSLDAALPKALAHRQDYQSLMSAVEAQRKRLEAAKAGRLPEVSLQASYGSRWDSDDVDEDNEVGRVGVLIDVPVFEGGRIGARIRRERSRLSAQEEALRNRRLQIQVEVETAVSNIESTRARVGVTEKAVTQAKESLRIEREKYELAKGAIVDVLDAQSALLDSQMNYYRALADYNTALAQFRLAVGEGR
ncbi:MAG: TolC family protein [Phycisphaerae bacterium]